MRILKKVQVGSEQKCGEDILCRAEQAYLSRIFIPCHKSHLPSNKELPLRRLCPPLIPSLCAFLLLGHQRRAKLRSPKRGLSVVFIPEQLILTSSLQRLRDVRIIFAAPNPQTAKPCVSGHLYGKRVHGESRQILSDSPIDP